MFPRRVRTVAAAHNLYQFNLFKKNILLLLKNEYLKGQVTFLKAILNF